VVILYNSVSRCRKQYTKAVVSDFVTLFSLTFLVLRIHIEGSHDLESSSRTVGHAVA
jgi:hypothetical protein